MKSKRGRNVILAAAFFIAFIVYTILVMRVDVQPIGPLGSSVGFASFNAKVAEMAPPNEVWYEMTQLMGYISILICALFAVVGAIQLFQTKSLLKVNKDIICLGVLYAVCIAFYVLFTFVTINCRPVLENGVLESSYPSSHTVLGICVFASLAVEIKRNIHDARAIIFEYGCYGFICLMVAGRILSGWHWASDIVGACILSAAFVSGFKAILPETKCAKDLAAEYFGDKE